MNRIAFPRLLPLASIAFAAAAAAQNFSPPPITAPSAPAGSTAADDASSRGMTAERRWQTDALRDAQDPTLERQKSARKGTAHPAKAEDLVVGAPIADKMGVEIGTIRGVEADGVVVATATGLIKIPADSLGKNSKGLLIGMSKADFDKLVAQAVGG
jgi:hypothetical protein